MLFLSIKSAAVSINQISTAVVLLICAMTSSVGVSLLAPQTPFATKSWRVTLFPRSPQETQHAILVRVLLLTLEDV